MLLKKQLLNYKNSKFMVQIYFAFRNAALFSDELMLTQPKIDIPGLLKKKSARYTFCWKYQNLRL